jgi:starch phosphorylase
VVDSRGWYNPFWHYEHDAETRAALDLILNDHFSPNEPGVFAPLRDTLLAGGDYYMHLADLSSYVETQVRAGAVYEDRPTWARKALLNIAGSGRFSSDRSISEYAAEIWKTAPSPIT